MLVLMSKPPAFELKLNFTHKKLTTMLVQIQRSLFIRSHLRAGFSTCLVMVMFLPEFMGPDVELRYKYHQVVR